MDLLEVVDVAQSNYTLQDIQQYAGRQYDYLVLEASPYAPRDLFSMTQYNTNEENATKFELFGNKIVSGVRKLAQRWLLEFLTTAGTMSKMKYRGTNFMRDALAGKYRSGMNVTHAFGEANNRIARNLKNEEDSTMPDDERFASAELRAFSTVPAQTVVSDGTAMAIVYLFLTVKINSLAGDAVTTLVPVPLLPKALR